MLQRLAAALGKPFFSVLFGVQLVEPLYDHIVDFLKISYVLSLGC